MFRFWIYSKNPSRHRLNNSIWRRSPNPHFSHHHWFHYIGSYSENFAFLCSDMDSPQKTSPDTSQTIPFGRGHPTLISATIIDLAILRVTVRILCFSMQIWILLEKLIQIQVEPSKTEVVKIWNHQGSISILHFLAQLWKVPAWDHQIWNLLKKAHPVIPISSILSWF